MNSSDYLAQSYHDAWEDYQRSLKNLSFPVWDYIVITACNEHQAEGFKDQIDNRKGFIPEKTKFLIIPDENGVRVGSGGATFSALKRIRELENSFSGLRILLIHSGGDSQRIPQYSVLGKLFASVPHELPDGRASTLFDEILIGLSAMPGRIREGMLIVSGSVLLMFNPLLIDYSGRGAAAISCKTPVDLGPKHGVFLRGDDSYVRKYFHKKSVEELIDEGAVSKTGTVDIDTGAIIIGTDILGSLWKLISTNDELDHRKYKMFVNSRVQLDFYRDFLKPLSLEPDEKLNTLEACGEYISEEVILCRKTLFEALMHFQMKLLRLAPAAFIDFGTNNCILDLFTNIAKDSKSLGWREIVNSSVAGHVSAYQSVMEPNVDAGENTYLESSYIHNGAHIGKDCIISSLEILNGDIPDAVVMHGLKQKNGRFVCRIYGLKDNPKEKLLFGKELHGDIWDDGCAHTLWNAKLYPECETMQEAVDAALKLYASMMHGEAIKSNTSLADGILNADQEAVLAWNRKMAELVEMHRISERIKRKLPAEKGILREPLSSTQKKWLRVQLKNTSYEKQMRLHYYVGLASNDETEAAKAFSVLSSVILRETLDSLKENKQAKIVYDCHEVQLPLRVNWGGGWSDTPPYCNENGGTVLNAAILIHGVRPVRVKLTRCEERKIIFESRDMDVHGEFDEIEQLQAVGNPYDPYVLQKAALLACGVIPAQGGNLNEILARLGGGFRMDTEVVGVPKGSGLGTSSILAAACVKGLFEFLGIEYSEETLYEHVLCMEQIMSTGGGWQDQVGGVTDGIKYTMSEPGLKQHLRVKHLDMNDRDLDELNERFALIYTGQRRLARNLLRDVVGRYIGNEPEAVNALCEIQRLAALMRFELERGHIDDFGQLLNEHWELSKQIDAGSTNTLIDQIFDTVDDLLAGKMVCGAGGGGFIQVLLKKGISKKQLQERLESVFHDTDIRVWDCTII